MHGKHGAIQERESLEGVEFREGIGGEGSVGGAILQLEGDEVTERGGIVAQEDVMGRGAGGGGQADAQGAQGSELGWVDGGRGRRRK